MAVRASTNIAALTTTQNAALLDEPVVESSAEEVDNYTPEIYYISLLETPNQKNLIYALKI